MMGSASAAQRFAAIAWRRAVLMALMVIAIFAAGCDDDDGHGGAATATPAATSTPTAVPTATPTPIELSARLDLDIRWSADVALRLSGDDLTVHVTPSDSRDVLAPGVMLEGTGRVERFPESEALLYTATLPSAAFAPGRCGAESMSLALSLFRRGSNQHVSGSLAVYCGTTPSGDPARMLRLAGALPTG